MIKFTFKTTRESGKYSWLHNPSHKIKLNKFEVGSIDHEMPHKIRLMVIKKDINEDGNPNCDFKWVTLAQKSESVDAAKIWLNENIDRIISQFTLKQITD